MTTKPPELAEADRYLLSSLRQVRYALRRSPTFQPSDAGYCDIGCAWHALTDQLFGRDIAHAYRIEAEGTGDVDAALAAAFGATARLVAGDPERWPGNVLRNARLAVDRFDLVAARALEIRTQTAVAPTT